MSKIEWTDQTWNPVVGCTPVSPGCLNCYAAAMAPRLAAMGQSAYVGLTVRKSEKAQRHEGTKARFVFNGVVRMLPERLTEPLGWKKPRMVFVDSMSDLFHKDVPFEYIDRVFAVMALTPRHTYQVLTKRPERMAEYLNTRQRLESIYDVWHEFSGSPREAEAWPLPNVWLGTSVEDQARADERIPHLLRCPAAVRFLSVEPMVGAVDLSAFFGGAYVGLPGDKVHENYNFGINWVICGGESGPGARPCNVEWIESIVKQCKDAGVPVFVKQLGARPTGLDRAPLYDRKGGDPDEWPEHLRVREWPAGYAASV